MNTVLNQIIASAFLLVLGCGNTSNHVKASEAKPNNKISPHGPHTVEEGGNNHIRSKAVFCPDDTLAGKFKVSREPDTGPAIALSLFLGDQATASITANSDDAFLKNGINAGSDPPMMCFVWDLEKPYKNADFITCRIGERYNGRLIFQIFASVYAVDPNGNAGEDITKYKLFVDNAPDGNICDQDFVELDIQN